MPPPKNTWHSPPGGWGGQLLADFAVSAVFHCAQFVRIIKRVPYLIEIIVQKLNVIPVPKTFLNSLKYLLMRYNIRKRQHSDAFSPLSWSYCRTTVQFSRSRYSLPSVVERRVAHTGHALQRALCTVHSALHTVVRAHCTREPRNKRTVPSGCDRG